MAIVAARNGRPMAAFVVCALVALIVLKPQEFVPALAGLPLLYVLFGLGAVLVVVDIIGGRIRPRLAPNFVCVALFFSWGLFTTALKRPDALGAEALSLLILFSVFAIVSLGVSSRFGITLYVATYLACALTVTTIAIVQGLAHQGCVLAAPDDWEGKGELEPDGRLCETVLDCKKDAPVPDGNYLCEHVGPWHTTSIGGRVRYRGSLADPNELSLMAAMSIPYAFALLSGVRRRQGEIDEALRMRRAATERTLPFLVSNELLGKVAAAIRAIPISVILGGIGLMTVFSKSRGGLLVFLLVIALQFIRKMGAWGIVAGCFVGPPMILLGGRSGAEAEDSANERTDLLREGFEFVRNTKGVGLGIGQFSDESSYGLTAHNAYLLAAAETGIIGLCLFGLVMYTSIKIPLTIWFRAPNVSDRVARLAPAVTMSLCGSVLGILFLSWTFKDILYLALGASAALYGAARAEDPSFDVRIRAREVVLICTGMLGLIFALYVGVRLKG
jgi:hypothetical protein